MYKIKKNPLGIYEKAIPNKFDWSDKILIAKNAGFDFIEMSIDESDERLSRLEWSSQKRQYIKELLEKNHFNITSMCLSAHRRFPFGSKDSKIRDRAYKILDKAIELAHDLGIKNIQLAGYDVYYEESDDTTIRLFEEGLKYAVKQAAAAGIMLSIEIMDTEFIGTITKCLKFIDKINSPWLQIYPDLGNLSQWTQQPDIELEKGINHIVAVHLKDTKPGIFKCVPFGEGTVEFEKLLKKLHELNYSGPFLIEMWAENSRDYTIEEAIDEIKNARLWIKKRQVK